MVFVLFGWYIFILCDLANPMEYLRSMFTGPLVSPYSLYEFVRSLVFVAVLSVASTPIPKKIYQRYADKTVVKVVLCIAIPFLLLLSTAYLVDSSYNPFLYFRF